MENWQDNFRGLLRVNSGAQLWEFFILASNLQPKTSARICCSPAERGTPLHSEGGNTRATGVLYFYTSEVRCVLFDGPHKVDYDALAHI
jgi:hypothetical protein